jgi:integrase
MPARRTKRADGRYSVTVRLESLDGTARRMYFYGRTQAEARVKAAAARERVSRGEPVRDATRTLSDWLAEWRTTFLHASDRAESTKDLYAGLMSRHFEPLIGHLALGQVKPSDITRVLAHMERLGRAASIRRNAYAALRSAFDDAVIDGLLAASPVLRVRRPKATQDEATSLTPDEVAQLLRGAAGLRYASVIRLILGTGLRRGEALALRWTDVHLDRCELSIGVVKRSFRDERNQARVRLLELFETLGNSDERVLNARRDLMTALF